MRICGLVVATATAVATTATATTTTTTDSDGYFDYGKKVLDWIGSSNGGYYNPKQELRREENPEDDPKKTSTIGIFATKDIEKGELLLRVPWSLIIKSDDETEEGQMCCGLVEAVAREMKLGTASTFAPHANYLNVQKHGLLPSDWSEGGKRLLYDVVGNQDGPDPRTAGFNGVPPDEPIEWLDNDWWKICEGDKDDHIANQAALLVVQRSDDYIMVPGYDMYNHRNGQYHNTEISWSRGNPHITRASRKIKKGEQIYNSYNFCAECEGRSEGYGTAEILRDYGFVEKMPQRWHYDSLGGIIQFDIDQDEGGNYHIRTWKPTHIPKDEYLGYARVWVARQIRKQRRILNMEFLNTTAIDSGIPQEEWDTIWEFHKYNLLALELAKGFLATVNPDTGKPELLSNNNKKNTEDEKEQTCSANDQDGTCSSSSPAASHQHISLHSSHYDDLDYVIDDLDYIASTCNNDEIMDFTGYENLEKIQTNYQPLGFDSREEEEDVCMDIDNIVQICDCYRPQYHEFVTHYAGRFIDTVKRIIFIGGGDSMLLHEALKYPTIEKVVGLELDQTVVRKSFKYFNTQPHFDDDRVEWWFGDATKSLLLLPEEYWGSFDLVLVDLSETVMSLSVTKEFDVFDALALLINPDGIMVKNELYLEHFSKVFDYTIQILYDTPIICSQVVAIGSNRVDFLHDSAKDHEIENLLYKPLIDDDNKFDLIHDYRKNDARAQGKCGTISGYGADDTPNNQLPKEQETSAGILEIVNAEQVSVTLDEGVVKIIESVVRKHGLTVVTEKSSSSSYNGNLVVVVMKEGYIAARMWPNDKYCGLDINLWGMTYKIKDLKEALTKAMDASLISAYKVVVGGMFGSNTWREDQKRIGPYSKIVKDMNRNCEEKTTQNVPGSTSPTEPHVIEVALNETLNLVQSSGSGPVVGVVCGQKGKDECLSLDFLKQNPDLSKVVPFWTCSDIDIGDESTSTMYACEKSLVSQLKDSISSSGKFDILVMDNSASYPMLQIFSSILGVDRYRESWIKPHNMVVAFSTKPEQEVWRKYFLDRYRVQHGDDPVARAEFYLSSDSSNDTVELGLVLCGHESYVYNLEAMEHNLILKLSSEKGVDTELRTINAGLFPYDYEMDYEKFKHSDYDSEPGLEQFYQQTPLGRQSVFQFEIKDGNKVSSKVISGFFEATLKGNGLDFTTGVLHQYTKTGADGIVIVFASVKGNVILVWDGRAHVDINYFIFDAGDQDLPNSFLQRFLNHSRGVLESTLRDDQPRGTGRVINFPNDLLDGDEEESDDEEED